MHDKKNMREPETDNKMYEINELSFKIRFLERKLREVMVKQEALISSMQVMARSIDELKKKDKQESPPLMSHETEPEIQIQIQKTTKRRKLDDTSWRDEIMFAQAAQADYCEDEKTCNLLRQYFTAPYSASKIMRRVASLIWTKEELRNGIIPSENGVKRDDARPSLDEEKIETFKGYIIKAYGPIFFSKSWDSVRDSVNQKGRELRK